MASHHRRSNPALQSEDSTTFNSALLAPSPTQLRELWHYDNLCGHKYMDMPLRQCSSIEPPDGNGATPISAAMMTIVKSQITDMWKQMSTIFEIFYERDSPDLGYRLRVKTDLPIKISLKEADRVIIGWKAMITQFESSPAAHIYCRSDMDENNQYLGGPVSYCNWAPTKSSTITVHQISHGSGKHLVRAASKALSAGCELLWDYGQKKMPTFFNEVWFQPECCFIADPQKHISKPKKTVMEVFKELCPLCGKPYKANRRNWTDRKCQKKVHFLNSHANYLGTDWDGCGTYDPSAFVVDYRRAQIQCERLCQFLKRLKTDSWTVVPACAVMSRKELETLSAETVMRTFAERVKLLKKLGSVVVRGNSIPSMVEHLYPIKPSSWDEIFPRSAKPVRSYAVPKMERDVLIPEVTADASQDVFMVLNIQEEDEDTPEEEMSDNDTSEEDF